MVTHFLLRWDFEVGEFLYIYRLWKDLRVQKACGTKDT